ncbi:hypothetical protein NQ317_000353 [Molorchus minor]|uniref:Uncharacterized protein n=1 Tax=Molorchus minor TaxID=1323400 RepID=A0ABQ9K189_9CUCU|nr:hypothetical protein NQ317_000353 [Molorchus minor]
MPCEVGGTSSRAPAKEGPLINLVKILKFPNKKNLLRALHRRFPKTGRCVVLDGTFGLSNAHGKSKSSFVMIKTDLFKRAVLFTLLNPQSCGAALAGIRKAVSMDISNYQNISMKIRGQGQYKGYKFFMWHKGHNGSQVPSYVHFLSTYYSLSAPSDFNVVNLPHTKISTLLGGSSFLKTGEPLDRTQITSMGILDSLRWSPFIGKTTRSCCIRNRLVEIRIGREFSNQNLNSKKNSNKIIFILYSLGAACIYFGRRILRSNRKGSIEHASPEMLPGGSYSALKIGATDIPHLNTPSVSVASAKPGCITTITPTPNGSSCRVDIRKLLLNQSKM